MNVKIISLKSDEKDKDTTIITIKYKAPALLDPPYGNNEHDARGYQDYLDKTQRRRNEMKKELESLHLGMGVSLILDNPSEEYERGFDDGYYTAKGLI